MNSKPFIIIGSIVLAVFLLTSACMIGFTAGSAFGVTAKSAAFQAIPFLGEAITTQAESQSQSVTPEELEGLFEPFWQAWSLVEEEFIDQPVDQEMMMRGAIRGMLESLGDQHSSYLDPDMFEEANAHLEGEEYEGIGAWVDTTQDFLTIISPMPGSPAEKAGLKPNDMIIAIDGEDMTGIDGELVRQRVLGPEGTTIILTISRESLKEPFDVDVTRSSIIVPTVDSKMLEENIAYIQLFTFGDKTAKDLKSALQELLKQEPDGLILDLRNNGGGYLQTAIEVVSEFVGDGVVMVEEFGDGANKTYESNGNGIATEIPLPLDS